MNNFAKDQEIKKNKSIDINFENLNSESNNNEDINFSAYQNKILNKNIASEKTNKPEKIYFDLGEEDNLSTETKLDLKKNNYMRNKTDEIVDLRCIYFLKF